MTNGLSLEELMKEGTYPEEYAEGENWRILHGDTLKLVKAFQPGIFDAVITDPPYASGGTKQNERNRTTNQKYSSMSAANALPDFDGDNKDQRSWTHWMAEWLYDVRKACKIGAPICLFIDWRQYPSITDALQWAGWIWRGTAVWDKGNSRPQKGRFRQFVQCDIDILGDATNMAEIELILATTTALSKICPDNAFTVRINDRGILFGMARYCGFAEEAMDSVLITLDKMDKIGFEGVEKELLENGNAPESVSRYMEILRTVTNDAEGVKKLGETLKDVMDPSVCQGLVHIMETVKDVAEAEFGLVFDPTLVRGMSYYTGTIFEVSMEGFGGSVAGGGRYDKMIGKFTGMETPACGFSIGFERIVTILLDNGFTVPGAGEKKAFLFEKGIDSASLAAVIREAMEERKKGVRVLVAQMNKNKKFQKEQLTKEGYTDFVEFYKNPIEKQ